MWKRVVSFKLDMAHIALDAQVRPSKFAGLYTALRWRRDEKILSWQKTKRYIEQVYLGRADDPAVNTIWPPEHLAQRFREAANLVEDHRLGDALSLVEDAWVELKATVER